MLRSVEPRNHSYANLSLEPHVFYAPAIVLAVDHNGQRLELSLRAGRRTGVVDNLPRLLLRFFVISQTRRERLS